MWIVRIAGGLLGLAALLAYLATDDVLLLWWSAVGVLTFALVSGAFVELQPRRNLPAWQGLTPEGVLWLTGAACTLIALSFHRPDYDSAFYVSIAVGAADHPAAPLMMDTIHGVEGLATHQPAHRVHTFELFQGAISYLTGVPALVIYHSIVPAFTAFLFPLAYARLFRILTPRHWPWSVLVVLLVLVGGGGTIFWYGDFSLVRIINGKSVYLSVFLPLAYAYGLRFGAQPGLRRFIPLAAVQIAAVGCSSSALWSVPIAAGTAMACSVRWDRNTLKTLGIGVLGSAYVVGVGLSLAADMRPIAANVATGRPPGAQLTSSLVRALGDANLETVALAALLLTWAVYRPGAARRFATVVPLTVLVLVLNPYFEEQVARFMTGPSVWRSMWGLPLPLLMALMLTAPLQLDRTPLQHALAGATVVLATASFLLFVPTHSTLAQADHTRFGRLGGLKVSQGNLYLADELGSRVPAGSMVVAPEPIALWVPALHHHPFVAASREGYLRRIEAELGLAEADRRMNMSEQVSRPKEELEPHQAPSRRDGFRRRSRHEDPVGWFREGLRRYDVRGVCINESALRFRAIVETLRSEGFTKDYGGYGHQIWIRSSAPERQRPGFEAAQ